VTHTWEQVRATFCAPLLCTPGVRATYVRDVRVPATGVHISSSRVHAASRSQIGQPFTAGSPTTSIASSSFQRASRFGLGLCVG
jgi:hypothetical protein